MLIEFRVENHRSLRDEQVLSMAAGRVEGNDAAEPRPIEGYAHSLLPAAALYGSNASGKSNVLSAIVFMRDAVLHSHRDWSPGMAIPCEPFAWGRKANEPSLFEATMVIDKVRYQYGFVVGATRVIEEWLYAWPKGKKQIWFQRDGDSFRFGEHLKGENKTIAEVTRSNALFVSTAAQLKHRQLTALYHWFEPPHFVSFVKLKERLSSPVLLSGLPLVLLSEDENANMLQLKAFLAGKSGESLRDGFRDLLRNADIGILDFRIVESEVTRTMPFQIQLLHAGKHKNAWLPLEEESGGTQMLFRLALPVLQVIQCGGIILIDEFDASLHPLLTQAIIELFNNPRTNPSHAQLIFTTHDTNLLGTTLGEPVLRRDQIWLTEKDKDGATSLYPLTDYKPRKAENLERGYLQGRYGAIPFLGNFTLQD